MCDEDHVQKMRWESSSGNKSSLVVDPADLSARHGQQLLPSLSPLIRILVPHSLASVVLNPILGSTSRIGGRADGSEASHCSPSAAAHDACPPARPHRVCAPLACVGAATDVFGSFTFEVQRRHMRHFEMHREGGQTTLHQARRPGTAHNTQHTPWQHHRALLVRPKLPGWQQHVSGTGAAKGAQC